MKQNSSYFQNMTYEKNIDYKFSDEKKSSTYSNKLPI